jgi:probable phosphoglycerate mutase
LDVAVGGGETPREVMQRQKEAMVHVINDPAERVLICMHGRAIRILLSWLMNYPLNFMDGFEHQNCAIYELRMTGSSFRLQQYNVTDHLR